MRLPELLSIKKIRKQIGINQTQLAAEAGVSQALIARIELGKVDPSYSKVRKIFRALEKLDGGRMLTAARIMNRKIISVSPSTSLRDAAALMRRKGISQILVLDNGVSVGSISEKTVLDSVARGGSIENVSLVPVRDIMDDAFPQVDKDSPLSVVSMLLEYNPAVLVTSKGGVTGIVTKADVLKLM